MSRFRYVSSLLKAQWHRLPSPRRGAAAITLPLLCLVLSFGSHLWLREKGVQSEKMVTHTYEILQQSHALQVEMLNAETGARGYFISQQPNFLQPYDHALIALPPIFDRLQQLTQDKPAQTAHIATLRQLVNQNLVITQAGIQHVRQAIATKTPVDRQQLQLVEGKAVMDQLRDVVTQFEAREHQLLEARQNQLTYQRDLNVLVILGGIMLSSVGAAVAVKLFGNLAADLNERELLLANSDSLVQAVFANVVDGVMVLNFQQRITAANQAAEQMFGYEGADLINQDWMKILMPHPVGNRARHPLQALPPKFLSGELWQTMGERQDGTWFPVEISVSTIDETERQVVIIRDVTDRQRAAAQLLGRAAELTQLNNQLKVINSEILERNRELDQFTYVVSHDLKAPLRAIANLSAWIEEDLTDQLPASSQHHLKLLRGRVFRLEALLNGLLDYSQVNRLAIAIEPVDVAELLARVVEMIAPPPTFGVEIIGPMPQLSTRRLLLQQVFLHLIENAVDHHPTESGTVRISVQSQGDYYKFTVADDGQGIDPHFHSRIYTIFQTLRARDVHESTGIGLAIVKKIVTMEGGNVHLKSDVGQGASFSFTWRKQPLAQSLYPIISASVEREI